MPAGIVKTPISGRAKDGAVAKSAEKTASGGKKFVQTRLPFKLITPGGGAGTPSATSDAATVTVILDEDEPAAPRKRKLSYTDETPLEGTGSSADQLRRSNSKENLDLGSSIATKKVKTTDALAEDVIELDDDNSDEEMADAVAEPVRESKETKTKPKKPEPKKDSSTPIQIKLPLVNKRSKRRKSLKKTDEALDTSAKDASRTGSESSDDIEALAEELNPQKKQKVQKPLEKSPEKTPKGKKQEEEVKEEKEPKKTGKESKKETPKTTVQNKKNDQSTIDLFIAKKTDTSKKEKTEVKAMEKGKKKDENADDSKTKEILKKDTPKASGKPKKEESKPVEKRKKEIKSQKEKEDLPAANNQKETSRKSSNPQDAAKSQKKGATKKDETISKKPVEKAKKPEPSSDEISDKESPEAVEVSVILSSSEDNSSSSEHEMDVDTDRASAQKETLLHRKSLPEATDAQKALTPKQQRLLEQRKKAREEKEQKLAEERRLKQQEKEQREQQKKQERDEKEQQRKLEKDQKEQQKKMEKEEKDRKRQAEVDSKNEEKRKRNEAKEEVQRKKDEERRKKEQEREEAEQKKKRAAESFTKFFVPKQPKAGCGSNNTSFLEHEQSSCDSSKVSSQTLAFRPFQVKDDMLLAPVVRTSLGQEQRSQLDGLFRHRDEEDDDDEEEDIIRRKPPNRSHLYLSELSNGRREPLKMQRDARLERRTKDEEEDDDVQVLDDLGNAGLPIEEEQPKLVARMRAKFLKFADNRRPPYYGTWRKKSSCISARRPLAQDKVHFDYELDSDCEWEEEEPGESLSASEDEKERESEEESEEEYNEWYVPHGHLSDEELQNDDEEMDDGHTREAQKAKLQVLQQEFAQEMKKQTKKIKPRLLGPVWLDENGNKSQLFPAIFAHTIDMYACWQIEPLSLEPPAELEREDQPPEPPVPLQLDDCLIQQLVRLTHGNRNSKMFLINEYLEYLKNHTAAQSTTTILPSKTVLREKIEELASWKTVELGTPEAAANANSAKKSKKPKKRLCWVVTNEMLEKFQLTELPLQNEWEYTLTPKVSKEAQHELSPPADADANSSLNMASGASSAPTTPIGGPAQAAPASKKRATLIMSVPRDQPIPTATKNKLISQFLRRQSDASSPKEQKNQEKPPPAVSDDVVLLSD
ncbi:chromatin assembly factor 1 subunit A-B [Drosophila eugracilis]|uniref:chromatin assembly factor 1 subunit A-B n=1 Tax=Drosophila eugracilis TaxID=29029 RepID=UPI0007E8634B|nr:chromatin assembly factor 1 subunit A-B [Drosophila eugracilis]